MAMSQMPVDSQWPVLDTAHRDHSPALHGVLLSAGLQGTGHRKKSREVVFTKHPVEHRPTGTPT